MRPGRSPGPRSSKVFILVGVGPLRSAKAAEWMRAHVPGMHMPDAVIARLQGAADQAREGRKICVELIQEIRNIHGVHGVHVMAYRQEETVAEIIDRSGVLGGRVPWYPAARSANESRQESIMTDTVISSATREVVIGFERPFVMIGERINPTGRKILAAEMAAGDFSRVEADARAGRGRRPHARRQCRHSAGRRAGHPGEDHAAGAVDHRRAAVDRLLDRRGARGRTCRLQGQGAGQLGDR